MTHSSLPKRTRALALRNDFSPFGNKLIQQGVVDHQQMEKALVETRRSGRPLTAIVEELTGKALSPELVRQYKKHHLFELKILYGLNSIDPEVQKIDIDQMGELINSLVPVELCRRHRLLPIRRVQDEVIVAMVEPDNLAAQDDLNRLFRLQNLTLRRIVITEDDYRQVLDGYLEQQVQIQIQQQEQAAKAAEAAELKKAVDIEDLDLGVAGELDEQEEESADLMNENQASSAPVIKLVNKVLLKALQEGASDIHIEPQENDLRIRFRKDGVLQYAFDPLPKRIVPAVTARFKIMADLDIAERRVPQDGRIRRMFKGRKVDFRVNSLPSRYGEKIVLRILDNSSTQLGLDLLITNQNILGQVREMAQRPFGLILVTGPTGSGKSTTLYSILAERNEPGINISTAEDPIEYTLPGITQVQVIREKGMDFASILRAFLRQDPDVILVGETRDKETAKTAIEAALTGHLVLTTLHTNDAPGAIARLDEMGVEPFMISGSLLGVLAQRLMRRVCGECRIPYQPTVEELARYGLSSNDRHPLTVYRANTLTPEQIQMAKEAGSLCPKCGGGGYKGRVGVYEFMQNSEEIERLINTGATTDMIKEVAVQEGMLSILAYSLELVKEGHTTFEEVDRVTFTDSGLEAELKAKRKTGLVCDTCNAELQPDWLDCPYCMTPRFS
ncbi:MULTISPECIES: GspE/PulE family protein [Cyanophyceae]|uniref:GspE/PulE family protein n=1 Tax=Cyanophyceae TaxID=3028117 RepID=UPI00016DC654|nr:MULTISPECIES: GspE/PulE family protein [Cyanophyceae]ACA98701.1 general secretion pathway protein E [Picosynechococcus sp. PCC 7002]SMH39628.1 type IV pilus assembly protein PilB [Picosynechococcus sp. OG1]SMQ78237.1 type IV pilus assembly protein PilB [Synechococcus sp. 7002]